MTPLSTVPADRLQAVLAAFDALTWPAGRDDAHALVSRLGWSVVDDTANGVGVSTGLPVDDDYGDVLLLTHGHDAPVLGDVTVNVSDWRGNAPASAVRTAYRAVRDAVTGSLGPETRVDRWQEPRTVWDRPGGGRVVVQQLDDVVILRLVSREAADVERAEERLGVDPGRVPGTGHEDL